MKETDGVMGERENIDDRVCGETRNRDFCIKPVKNVTWQNKRVGRIWRFKLGIKERLEEETVWK